MQAITEALEARREAARLGGAPSMALGDIVRGIEIILTISATRTDDLHTAEGRIS